MAAALTGTAVEKVIWTDDHRILITCVAERSDWLVKFGSAERLDQALLQAAGYVQPNNRAKPLLAQVRAQLAQQLARRMDQDARYQSSKTKQGEDPGKAWLLRDVSRPDVAKLEIEGNYV